MGRGAGAEPGDVPAPGAAGTQPRIPAPQRGQPQPALLQLGFCESLTWRLLFGNGLQAPGFPCKMKGCLVLGAVRVLSPIPRNPLRALGKKWEAQDSNPFFS